MALNRAQLLTPPVGTAIGAVKAGSGVTVVNGVISVSATGGVSQIVAGAGITITPSGGTGAVDISLTTPPTATDFPSGTVMPFSQATAPTNWTKNTDFDNGMLRIVSGTGGGTGGSSDFTTAFVSYSPTATISSLSYSLNSNTSQTTLTPSGVADISGAKATTSSTSLSQSQGGTHDHIVPTICADNAGTSSILDGGRYNLSSSRAVAPSGSNQPHTHSWNGNQASFSGSPSQHSHGIQASGNVGSSIPISMNNINLSVQYRDLILCTRS